MSESALAAVRAAAQTADTKTAQAATIAGSQASTDPKQPDTTAAAGSSGQPAAQAAATQAAVSADQVAAAKADGHKEGVKAERQRLSAIMKLDSAKDRQPQALALALDTDVTVDQADAVLKSSPAGAKANSFEAAMAKLGNPDLGTNAAGAKQPRPALDHAGIFQQFNNPSGK